MDIFKLVQYEACMIGKKVEYIPLESFLVLNKFAFSTKTKTVHSALPMYNECNDHKTVFARL